MSHNIGGVFSVHGQCPDIQRYNTTESTGEENSVKENSEGSWIFEVLTDVQDVISYVIVNGDLVSVRTNCSYDRILAWSDLYCETQ
jgi:hypothetical protein